MVDSRIVVSKLSDEHVNASPSKKKKKKKSLEIGQMFVLSRGGFSLAVLEILALLPFPPIRQYCLAR